MTSEKDIDWMLSQNEGQYIEFKQSVSNTAGEAICAFANSSGGSVIVGVRSQGGYANIADPSDAAARLENIARTCDPPVQINITHFKREENNLMLAEVPESANKPHSFGSVFFMRVGHQSQRMRRDEVVEFMHATGQVKYEEKLRKDFTYLEDFDNEAFQKFLRTSGISQPENIEDLFLNLGIAKQEGDTFLFNNVGVLFFSREPRRFLRHAVVDCILFAGTDKVDILDRKEQTGNLMDNVEQAMIFLKRHLSLRYEITELKRKEILEIPEAVLREAILNAVIHRDYHFDTANISVEIYRDRVEISSPGGLPPGLKPEEFGIKSVRRNSRIAEMFHRLGEVEHAGTGIGRIRNLARDAGLKEPKFDFTTFFTTTFERAGAHDEEKTTQKTTQKTAQKTTQKQDAIIEYLRKHPSASRKELADNIDDITESGIKYNLKRLQELGLIKRVGPDKGGYWEVIK